MLPTVLGLTADEAGAYRDLVALPLKLVVIDRRLAYQPAAADDNGAVPCSLVVHESNVLDTLWSHAQLGWHAARQGWL